MSTDLPLPKDPIAANEILVALEEKDKDETICRYPTCHNLRPMPTGTGRPSAYCPDHTAVANHRARASLRAAVAGGTPEGTSKREVPHPQGQGIAPVESLRTSVMSRITQLQGDMERYLTTLVEISDPDLAAAQIQTTLDRAESRIAEAQESASVERSLRLAADMARQAAQEEARTEREAADQAIGRMEEAEARTERIREEAERVIAELQTEQAIAIERLRREATQRQEELERQAQETITRAHEETAAAELQARQAETRALNAETEARIQQATAERLVREAQTALDRERSEVYHMRNELAAARTLLEQANSRAEADRVEARATLERERAEVDRLRSELTTTRARAEQLIALSDELRTQMMQIQVTQRENLAS
jgi:colicin import membrane protein